MPKVSVIIPTFNSLSFLPDAVQSVLDQTFTDFDILIVNDGSTDETETWVQAQTDPRIQLISQSNQGKSAARNRGMAAAQGEYLAFLDADDLWESTKLAIQVERLDRDPAVGLVYTWTALADETGQLTGRLVTSDCEGFVWPDLILSNVLGCGSTPLVRQSCFATVGLFDESLPLAQDWEMWVRLARQYPFGVIQQPLVRYRQHAHNTSANWQLMGECRLLILEKALAKGAPQPISPEALSALEQRAYYLLYSYLSWLATRSEDHQQAFAFWQRSIQYRPRSVLSKKSANLLAMIMLSWGLGADRLNQLLKLLHAVRRQLNRSAA